MSALPTRQPVLFVGHGSPINAFQDSPWGQGLRRLAAQLPRPRAVLSISAHWYRRSTLFTGSTRPRTLHDFHGFPEALYRIRYPAPGDPGLARRAAELSGKGPGAVTEEWGLDHGTWCVLLHLFPGADVPVVQMSIDAGLAFSEHLALGRALAPLREEGVLILGSGNATHNLAAAFSALQRGDPATPPWAGRFDAALAQALERRDTDFLLRALDSGDGRLAHPSPDHYLPLLYAVGASAAGDPVRFPITGFDLGSLSMRAVVFG